VRPSVQRAYGLRHAIHGADDSDMALRDGNAKPADACITTNVFAVIEPPALVRIASATIETKPNDAIWCLSARSHNRGASGEPTAARCRLITASKTRAARNLFGSHSYY
jgi:hypothetical protein